MPMKMPSSLLLLARNGRPDRGPRTCWMKISTPMLIVSFTDCVDDNLPESAANDDAGQEHVVRNSIQLVLGCVWKHPP